MPSIKLEDVLKEDFLCCKGCKEIVQEPKILTCMDNSCDKCVNNKKECAACKEPIVTSPAPPSNVFVKGLLKLADCRKKTEKNCDYCRFEGNSVPAIIRCVECGDNMCDECADAHKKTKLTREHSTLTFKEIQSGRHDEKLREGQRILCSTHKDEPLAKFCVSCQILVCRECREADHESHPSQPISEAVSRTRDTVETQLGRVREKLPQLKEYCTYLEDYQKSVTEKGKKVGEAIEDQAKDLHKLIDEYKAQILQQAEEVERKEVENIEGKLKRLKTNLTGIENSCFFVTALTEHGRPEEMLAIARTVQDRLQYLGNQQFEGASGKLDIEFHRGAATEKNTELMFGKLTLGNAPLGPDTPRLPQPMGMMPSHQNGPPSVHFSDSIMSPRSYQPLNSQRSVDQYMGSGTYMFGDDYSPNQGMQVQVSNYKTKTMEDLPKTLPKAELVLEFEAQSHTDTRDIWPTGVAFSQETDDIYILDRDNKCVKVYDENGQYKFEFGNNGSVESQLSSPYDLALSDTGVVYVTDYQFEEVKSYDAHNGKFLCAYAAGFKHPRGIAVNSKGHFIVADCRLRQISFHDPNADASYPLQVIRGTPVRIGYEDMMTSGGGDLFTDPYYVGVTPDDCTVVTDWAAPSLKIFDPEGYIIKQTGSYGTHKDQMLQPYGVCCDQHGHIMVADNANHRVHMAAPNGSFIRHLISKSDGLWHPMALALDPSQGRLIVTEALGKIKVFKYI